MWSEHFDGGDLLEQEREGEGASARERVPRVAQTLEVETDGLGIQRAAVMKADVAPQLEGERTGALLPTLGQRWHDPQLTRREAHQALRRGRLSLARRRRSRPLPRLPP